ncbi:hypothetical protein MXMO3_02729 [Maritalea myrionectae]|uniref:EBNA-1 nuclear protein n=1 Tax=Maritalea myrionectae TaxID=454601 RepID=A0A2R4MGW3_9HYPH|nr:DUF1611 domain-containing protein [Maritalea myrionectae]AVX05240.1 hypothetical protein MXMO3_02729 [Maritalea myrionectae]
MTDNFEMKRHTPPMQPDPNRSQHAANEVFEPAEHGLSMTTNTALVYCEGNFGALDGKTANGLVRHSEKYDVRGVIDSEMAGQDSGMVLDGINNSIPIYRDLADALENMAGTPDYFIFGMAPASGMLSARERSLLIEAMSYGMDIVNGLHEFLNEDPVFIAASAAHGVSIIDVRKPRDKKHLRMFSGRIAEVTCPVIAVLGTDGAIGKRTTSTILTNALVAHGIKAIMIGTGQTGLIQGARYGIAIDAIPAQFCSGEMESTIVDAFERENPDVIIVEGQGALSHPAYLTSTFILRGSQPDGVILQHAPGRSHLGDFPETKMPTAKSEINLIETFSDTKVIGVTINHENMSDEDVSAAIKSNSSELGIPVTDALTRSTDFLVDMVVGAFPELAIKRAVNSH